MPWSATAARPVALEGVGEHVRVEVITQPEFGGEIAESFRKRKVTFPAGSALAERTRKVRTGRLT